MVGIAPLLRVLFLYLLPTATLTYEQTYVQGNSYGPDRFFFGHRAGWDARQYHFADNRTIVTHAGKT